MLTIRRETPEDYQAVEDLTRKAFYNQYLPGCVEHYLVRLMRNHEDFIPELTLVAELDGKVIGNIMYTRARLVGQEGEEKQILTFGPVSVLSEYQRQGYGKALIQRSFQEAVALGYDTVVIFGTPANYVGQGFVSCKRHNVRAEDGRFPTAMLKELVPGALNGKAWTYHDSPVMAVSEVDALAYDDTLEPMERKRLPCQEEFFILSNSTLPEESS